MGTGIAACFVAAKIPVCLIDASASALAASEKSLLQLLGKSSGDAARLVRFAGDLHAARDADLVVEAVFEDMALKQDMFRRLDGLCKPAAFLCSNTSYLDIDALASATRRPDRVMGLHFFSPASKMPLLEEVRGRATSADCIRAMMQLGKTLRKTPVLVGNCHGFVGNRLFAQYTAAADRMVLRGISPFDLDAAAEAWGMKMGPFAVHDLVGLDLRHRQRVAAGTADPSSDLYDAVSETGRLGQKNGRGFYTYDETRRRTPDLSVLEMVRSVATHLKIAQDYRETAPEAIALDLLLALINEAFHILDEKIASKPSDIDLILILGYGFPRWRGGPLWYAEHHVGFAQILSRLREKNIAPSPLLIELVDSHASLDAFWKKRHAHNAKL